MADGAGEAPAAAAGAAVAAALRLAQARPELQPDPLARHFVSIVGIVAAHNRGQFAHECWQCQCLCRETRYVAGVTQPGSIADLVFHGCRLGGVTKLLEEARAHKREEYYVNKGTTQLMRAALDNDVERVRELFRLGCPNIDAQDEDGFTPLYFARFFGNVAVVRELLAHGADVNIKGKSGSSPLTIASYCNHLYVILLLCDAPGIDLSVRIAGKAALGWALACDRPEIAAFLRSRGAPE